MAALPSPIWNIWKRTLVWLNYHTYLKKNKGETCLVQEPSHVKQLSPIHVCKIGLRNAFSIPGFDIFWPQHLSCNIKVININNSTLVSVNILFSEGWLE
jgi:hypothetical protein